jgi:hypothetical protein
MKSLIKKEWIRLRNELQVQYFDIDHKMRLKKNAHQLGIYEEALQHVSLKLQRLDGLINPPIEARLNLQQQLTEIY